MSAETASVWNEAMNWLHLIVGAVNVGLALGAAYEYFFGPKLTTDDEERLIYRS